MTEKPAANLSTYLLQWGVKVKEIIEITKRPRSTVDDWWKRQDLAMLNNAIKAILWDKATTQKAKNYAIKRKLGELPQVTTEK